MARYTDNTKEKLSTTEDENNEKERSHPQKLKVEKSTTSSQNYENRGGGQGAYQTNEDREGSYRPPENRDKQQEGSFFQTTNQAQPLRGSQDARDKQQSSAFQTKSDSQNRGMKTDSSKNIPQDAFEVEEDKNTHKFMVRPVSFSGSSDYPWMVECDSRSAADQFKLDLTAGRVKAPTEASASYKSLRTNNNGKCTVYGYNKVL